MKKTTQPIALALWFFAMASGVGSEFQTLLVDYSDKVDAGKLAAYDVAVIYPTAVTDLVPAKQAGTSLLAYISAAEVAPHSRHRDRVLKEKHVLLGKNDVWGGDLPDVSSPKWRALLLDLAKEASEKGFDGFFFDTVDSVDLLAQKFPARAGEFRAGLVAAIKDIHAAFPDKKIVLNRGFSILEELKAEVDGVLVESLYQTYDFASKTYKETTESERAWLLDKLNAAKKDGMGVYVVDYVDPSEKDLAMATAQKIEASGFIPFITTPDLHGASLAPLRQVARKIAVIYGRQVETNAGGSRYWPADTWVSQSVHLPLEWMGYRVDYFDVYSGALPILGPEYSGIIFDAYCDFSEDRQKEVIKWLMDRPNKNMPILIFGNLPFDDRYASAFGRMLGMEIDTRTTASVNLPRHIRIEKTPITTAETKPKIIPYNYPIVVAPPDANIVASTTFMVPGDSVLRKFDAVFTAPWGGMALNPFLRFERPDNVALWGIDPFAFLSEALKFKPFPAADPTTRDGLRLIFSHVDADGFSNYSAVESGKFSAEVIRDHIYKKYPLPITSSIIEAEVRGYLKRQKPGDEKVLLEIAKDIFALPNILISSHTYSHPFFWMKDDKTQTIYEVQALELGEPYNLGEISPEREIRGSIEFIRKELAPPGKPVDLILWSGNCRPGPESLQIAEDMGIENMNGGDTVISRSRPTLGAVAPLSVPWGDYLQIHAAIQNEMLFTDGFEGPRWGGYQNVIQTFERTELPRRLKPVGIYFHMFMGDRLESLNSLKKVFDWSMAQPLQATSATAFARSVRQTREAVLFEAGPNRWVAVHGPDLRTFRLPDSGLKPDFSKSQNLIGYNTANGQIFFSSGRGLRTEIVLDQNPTPHIYLESSTAEVEVTELKPQSIALHAKDFRPVTVVLAGLTPNSPCSVTANGVEQKLETDGAGRLTVTSGESLDLKINGAPIL